MFTRTRYQKGSLQMKPRSDGKEAWEFRYYEADASGRRRRRTVIVGSMLEYQTESAARRSQEVQAILLRVNAETRAPELMNPDFGAILARYEREELPERYSTRSAYLSYINNHIRPRWAEIPVSRIRPMVVEDWLKQLKVAPGTKGHIRGIMHTVFRCAERWELVEKNPMRLVRVKGSTKRLKTPRVLTPDQFRLVVPFVREPFRTMVLIAGCLGLRVSEIVGLKWGDFRFDDLTLLVQRSVVHGRVGDVKTEYSRDTIPLDSALVEALLNHRELCLCTPEGCLFANPATGKPYHQEEIQKNHIRKAGIAAGIGTGIGWHTFRHSYRSWLAQRAEGADAPRQHSSHYEHLRQGHD